MTPQFFAVWSLVDHGQIYEPAADPGDFDYFDGAAVCSGSTAQCYRIETKGRQHHQAKTQTYCQILDLSDELDQADQQKDREKAEELSQKINELQKNLAPNTSRV